MKIDGIEGKGERARNGVREMEKRRKQRKKEGEEEVMSNKIVTFSNKGEIAFSNKGENWWDGLYYYRETSMSVFFGAPDV